MDNKMLYAESKSTSQKKKSLFEKIKEHKTEIVIAGVTFISVAGAILVAKNWGVIRGRNATNLNKGGVKANNDISPLVPEVIENVVIKNPSNKRVIDVRKHIRNLPKGWKASCEKVDSAIENGIVLGTSQTWVDDYSKVCA